MMAHFGLLSGVIYCDVHEINLKDIHTFARQVLHFVICSSLLCMFFGSLFCK